MYRLVQSMYDECDEINISDNEINTIMGNDFRRLLDICYESSSYFSLTKAPWDACVDTDLEKDLEPFLIKRLRTKKWFCYDFSPSPSFLEVHIYKATPATKDILLKYFDDIFLRKQDNGIMTNSTQTLEDLCFFTGNLISLGTVTHEAICHVYPTDEAVEQAILLTGKWKYINDKSTDQFKIE